jgi:hypothetical protein
MENKSNTQCTDITCDEAQEEESRRRSLRYIEKIRAEQAVLKEQKQKERDDWIINCFNKYGYCITEPKCDSCDHDVTFTKRDDGKITRIIAEEEESEPVIIWRQDADRYQPECKLDDDEVIQCIHKYASHSLEGAREWVGYLIRTTHRTIAYEISDWKMCCEDWCITIELPNEQTYETMQGAVISKIQWMPKSQDILHATVMITTDHGRILITASCSNIYYAHTIRLHKGLDEDVDVQQLNGDEYDN